ncbi:MAG: hypothetical protein CVV64_11315 [Candidatus Wallbacteria bacterium HGW-Wallbacteria-1]|jgi:hypothetical protein|uniref:SGNH hydrolase-type esterase domain-containing protein n=1 Tax=Candidatus Wallbacteria bacterium HGW-Wallbacteria-1 TaxID=2013854 RepID=A0A2N1PP51_9BACT|nr:MAG: hypothetical protein CVV64_11315 [Candidatus Wallbacteria bacterium HGW-Wallbacteria-1]
MNKILNFTKIIVINFAVFSTILVGTEIAGQFIYLAKNRTFLAWKKPSLHSKVFEIHPFLAGRLKSSIFEMNSNGISITTTKSNTRWTGASNIDGDLIRVAILGGSTVFGTGVTDSESWPALLQKKLGDKYAVINYGVPGYSTVENIIQMALIVPEVKPHIVIFYEGWNDIKNYHEKDLGVDYYAHGISQYSNLNIPLFEYKEKIYTLQRTFVIPLLIDKLKQTLFPPEIVKDSISGIPDFFVDDIYSRNLRTLKVLSLNINARAVFVPQILNYSFYSASAGSRPWTKHIKSSSMFSLMTKFNECMERAISSEDKNCVFFDSVLKIQWKPDDFLDEGHFSLAGGIKFSDSISVLIRNEFDGNDN